MTEPLRLKAPAKVNLGLRIVGRRADGYHLLESLFVPLELADDVSVGARIEAATRVELALRDPSGQLDHDPDPARNLATRAARAFLQAAGRCATVEIELYKRIPAGAGLGGGSSDAGAVLRALDRAFPGALRPAELARVALSLGADVPFFLSPTPAWVSGIGEEITPFDALPGLHLLVATPSPPLSTAMIFRRFAELHPQLTPSAPRRRIRAAREERAAALLAALAPQGAQEGAGAAAPSSDPLRNDLETVAVTLRPEIGRLREKMLSLGARAAAMSGSGPSVFGVFANRETAREAMDRAKWEPETQVHVSGTFH